MAKEIKKEEVKPEEKKSEYPMENAAFQELIVTSMTKIAEALTHVKNQVDAFKKDQDLMKKAGKF